MRLILGMMLMCAMSMGHAEEQRVSTGSRTYCLGRYLIDLPAGAQVSAQYTFADSKVVTHFNVSQEAFAGRAAAREAELENAGHKQGGSMFVDRDELSPERITLVSWSSPNSRYLYQYDDYAYFPRERVLYQFHGKGDATRQARARAREYGRALLEESLRYREWMDIPEGPGFCIESGLIARNRLNKEEVLADIRLRGYPSVTLNFMSYVTGDPDRELLSRASSISPEYEEVARRMKTLRRGGRDLGPVKGQEILVRGDGERKKAYQFLWESQGSANSQARPFLSLELSTTSESDDEGEVIDAPFRSDEEAMELWDTILGTLRLRPGAVIER